MRKHNKNSCDWIAGSSSAMTTALLITTVLFSFDARATTCTATPECAALGYKYTEAECEKGAVKCPNGNSYYCPNPRLKCNIGDIFYVDNTCGNAANYDGSKMPLGVVVYVNANGVGGQVMAPRIISEDGIMTDSRSSILWSREFVDIAGLHNYPDPNNVNDYDSCKNTDKIVAQGNDYTYPAAWATRKYAPTPLTAGKWCLPAAGVLNSFYNNRSSIEKTFKQVFNKLYGTDSLPDSLWSSSVMSSAHAYFLLNGRLGAKVKNGTNGNVIPVLEF